ncbi:MAG: putative HD phosphohydrolase [Oceanospirillaceae bacterium]|jgi:predicted HD phosphohydrolase
MATVSFTQMKHGTHKDYAMLQELEHPYHAKTAQRLLNELARQGEDSLDGYPISRLEHSLQSATRAWRNGADDDWIVAALLHDIGDGLAPQNHDRMAAEIIRPFVREEVSWVIEHHGTFQMIYYAHHLDGWNPNERDKYRNNPYYQTAVDFCELWDQNCFDPSYDSQNLDFFAPKVEAIFQRKAYTEDVIKAGQTFGLGSSVE